MHRGGAPEYILDPSRLLADLMASLNGLTGRHALDDSSMDSMLDATCNGFDKVPMQSMRRAIRARLLRPPADRQSGPCNTTLAALLAREDESRRAAAAAAWEKAAKDVGAGALGALEARGAAAVDALTAQLCAAVELQAADPPIWEAGSLQGACLRYMEARGHAQGPFTPSQLAALADAADLRCDTLVLHARLGATLLRCLLPRGACGGSSRRLLAIGSGGRHAGGHGRELSPDRARESVGRLRTERGAAAAAAAERHAAAEQRAHAEAEAAWQSRRSGWAARWAAELRHEGDAAVELGPSGAAEYQSEWVIAGVDGPDGGPFSRGELRQLLLAGRLAPSALVTDEEDGFGSPCEGSPASPALSDGGASLGEHGDSLPSMDLDDTEETGMSAHKSERALVAGAVRRRPG
ncbi:hypothetical protein WJX81_008178 [Elliptochloris bilobata]|uniref:GYF domain-containing protein n=1 Tax=Elliptochloris bilobata TaxID=381761 RepID=A0AAW1QJ14_9CHLO